MGIKIPMMAGDTNLINFKADRLRILKSEKNQNIEQVLRSYSKQSSVYSSTKVNVQTAPERNFRSYIDNHVNMLSRLSAEHLRSKIFGA